MQNELDLFTEKLNLSRKMREVENTFKELECQYVTYVDSLLLENRTLRHDNERMDTNHCVQLTSLRSANDRVNESLTKQIRYLEKERDQLSAKYSRLTQTYSVDVNDLQNTIAEESDVNLKLNSEILRVREKMKKNDQLFRDNMRKMEEVMKIKITKNFELNFVRMYLNFNIRTAVLKSVLNNVKKSLTGQVECLERERNRLSEEYSLLSHKNGVQVQNLKNSIAVERDVNRKLNDDVVRIRKQVNEWIQNKIDEYEESIDSRMTDEHRRTTTEPEQQFDEVKIQGT